MQLTAFLKRSLTAVDPFSRNKSHVLGITGSHFKRGDLMSECLLSTSYSWFARKSFVFDQFVVVPKDG